MPWLQICTDKCIQWIWFPHSCEIRIFWWAQTIAFLKERYIYFFLTTKLITLDIRGINETRKYIPCFLMLPEAAFIAVLGLWRTYARAPLNWHSQIESLKICTYKMPAFPELVAALFNRPLKVHLEDLSQAHVCYRYFKLVNPG